MSCDKQRRLRGCGIGRHLGEYIGVATDADTYGRAGAGAAFGASRTESGAFFRAVCTVVRLSLRSRRSRTAFAMPPPLEARNKG